MTTTADPLASLPLPGVPVEREGTKPFVHLDAAQLVKHGFGFVTDARRKGKAPTLFYIFAEPAQFHGRAIAASATGQTQRTNSSALDTSPAVY